MFAAAMDLEALKLTTTENGRPSHATMGDARVDAFFKMVRGLPRADLEQHIENILTQAADAVDDVGEQATMVVDLFLLWASTRDVRGGKGERQLAHWLLVSLAKRFRDTVQGLLPLIPEYGSWRDVVALLEFPDLPAKIQEGLLEMMANQLTEDSKQDSTPTLCAKWAPRPTSAHKGVAKKLASVLFPDAKHPEPLYRKALAAVNRRLGTVEIKMCDHQWSEIDPGTVPGRCLKVHRAAFMNEVLEKKKKPGQEIRHEADEDRMQCRRQFLEFATSSDPAKRLHGRVLHPHEMVSLYMRNRSGEVDVILEAQWTDLRERLKEEMPALGKMVPLVDVSGSMSGTPMEVAVALGVLISEVGPIKDRFITFSSDPAWHKMQGGWSLKQKVHSALSANWGTSTNFQKALELILKACVEGDVPPEEVGELSLVVLSDMQFDAAAGHSSWGYYGNHTQKPAAWETQHQALQRLFAEAGLESKHKQPYPVPRVVYWNLRGDTRDFPVEADTPGVQICSGFSPNLLKLFMEDKLEEMVPTSKPGESSAVNPYETVRRALDDPRYQPVREICERVGEGPMANYTAPEPVTVPEDLVVV